MVAEEVFSWCGGLGDDRSREVVVKSGRLLVVMMHVSDALAGRRWWRGEAALVVWRHLGTWLCRAPWRPLKVAL